MPLLFSDQPETAENSIDRKQNSAVLHFQWVLLKQTKKSKAAYWLLCGKSRRCVIVTNGWFKVFSGVILLSASIVNIFFNKSMYSLRSAFSANMSVPSKSVDIFTLKIKWEQFTQTSNQLLLNNSVISHQEKIFIKHFCLLASLTLGTRVLTHPFPCSFYRKSRTRRWNSHLNVKLVCSTGISQTPFSTAWYYQQIRMARFYILCADVKR